jgi:hypothetical protein
MRPILSTFAFLFCAGVGYLLAVQSWGGVSFVYLGETRAPASVRKAGDYVAIPQSMLHQSAHAQLMTLAAAETKDGLVGIHLGNPLVRNANGETDFACRTHGRTGLFDRVELVFTGTGISEGGENPEMTVVSACEGGTANSDLAPVWIPIVEIMKEPATDREMNFEGAQIRLISMPGQWPVSWVLSRVRLFKQEDSTANWTVDAAQMRRTRPDLISF